MTDTDIEQLRTWVGREQRTQDTLPVFPARALAAALDHADLPEEGDPLPPSWHWLYFHEAVRASATGVDGHPKRGEFLPPIDLPRRMWAAGAVTVVRPLRLGKPATKHTTIRSVDHKSGRSGELIFVTLDHRISQDEAVCVDEEQTLVYRAMPRERVAPSPGDPAPATAQWAASFRADAVALFRFSALTYNGHRIHYDREYAMRQEFYDGLVVHGPLLVTLLLDLLARQAPALSLRTLRFRAVRPTFDLEPVLLRGTRAGDRVDLWTADRENNLGMSAVVTLGEAS